MPPCRVTNSLIGFLETVKAGRLLTLRTTRSEPFFDSLISKGLFQKIQAPERGRPLLAIYPPRFAHKINQVFSSSTGRFCGVHKKTNPFVTSQPLQHCELSATLRDGGRCRQAGMDLTAQKADAWEVSSPSAQSF
jgi:hypothetical protein